MNRRKISKYLAVIGMLALTTVNTFGATISDVTSSHWAYKAIVDIENKGIMSVNSKGQFLPNQMMTYFELADVIAKATGYVDVQVNTNVDETLKKQILSNYEKQKATLQSYAAKYSSWDKTYDQQIAYLLGRGYIASPTELDDFITTVNGKQSKAVVTKQELAVLIVRLLGKEKTAQNSYKSTGFADEAAIAEGNRPHVAYLKTLGLVSGDTKGNFGANTKVTRALCAKMVNDALVIRDQEENTTTEAVTETVTIKKILTKNTTEYYMLLERGDNTSYYSIKNTVKILDADGNAISIVKIPLNSQAKVKIEVENSTEYITSMQLVSGSESTESTTNPDTTTPSNESNTNLETLSGTLTEPSSNGIVRITSNDGNIKAYLLDANSTITLDGKSVSADEIKVGDFLKATLQDGVIIKLVATSNSTQSVVATGTVTKKSLVQGGYVLTVKTGTVTSEVKVSENATITRNNKSSSYDAIRTGDKVSFTRVDGEVTELTLTGTKQTVSGTVNAIHLSMSPEILLNVNGEVKTYMLGKDAELYDNNQKEYISLRDVHLGQSVDLILDSEEVISLEVVKGSSSVNYKATITSIARGYEYIDIIIDYDAITGEAKTYRRIQTPIDLKILLNGKVQHRSILEEDMEILVTYKYLDDIMPEKITIID